MNVRIRHATIANLKDIQELNLMLFKKEYSEYDKHLNLKWTFGKEGTEFFKDRILNTNKCLLVALKKNSVIGYLAGGICKSYSYRIMPKMAEVDNTFVLEAYRGQRIGTKLFKAFLAWCKKKKIKKLKVEASAQNKRAIRFYRKKGFKEYTLILEKDI